MVFSSEMKGRITFGRREISFYFSTLANGHVADLCSPPGRGLNVKKSPENGQKSERKIYQKVLFNPFCYLIHFEILNVYRSTTFLGLWLEDMRVDSELLLPELEL